MKKLDPTSIAAPFGRYSHGIEIADGKRFVMTSGQLPLSPDGTIPDGAFEQAKLCFENCGVILREAGLGPTDVVKIVAYVTDRQHMKPYMHARDLWVGPTALPPISTLLIVSGFTKEEFLVEIEVTAVA